MLQALSLSQRVELVGLITQPNAPQGRGRKLTPSKVGCSAETWAPHCPLFKPQTLRSIETLQPLLSEPRPDLGIVVAYGQKIPSWLLSLPRYGWVNIHASLLPKYRGANPIQRALIAGEAKTGVSLMKLTEAMDAGDVLAVRELALSPYDTLGQTYSALSLLGTELLIEWVQALAEQKDHALPSALQGKPQDPKRVTFAPKLTPSERIVDFNQSAEAIGHWLRALDPSPGVKLLWKSAKHPSSDATSITLRGFQGLDPSMNAPAGTCIKLENDLLWIACGLGAVGIQSLQLPGQKKVDSRAFVQGHPHIIGATLAPLIQDKPPLG